MSVLAVIPARGGSKRFPRKNLASFRGLPLLAWSIMAARCCGTIDRVVVSTDDQEIFGAALWRSATALLRPPELATDTASAEDVLRHAVTVFPGYEWTVLLQPTSPLRTSDDISECIKLAARDGEGCITYRDDTGGKNGAVYVMRTDLLMAGRNFDKPFNTFYMMPAERSLDIDYAEEMNLA